MTLVNTPFRRAAIAAGLAFLVAIAVLSAGGDDLSSPPRGPSGADIGSLRPTGASAGTVAEIRRLQAAVRRSPRAAAPRVALAGEYLQRVRETGDAAFYARAETLLRGVIAREPRNADALVGARLARAVAPRLPRRAAARAELRRRARRPAGRSRRARRARPLRRGAARAAAVGGPEAEPLDLRAGLVPARAPRRPPGRGQRAGAGVRRRRAGGGERRGDRRAARRPRARARAAGGGACGVRARPELRRRGTRRRRPGARGWPRTRPMPRPAGQRLGVAVRR